MYVQRRVLERERDKCEIGGEINDENANGRRKQIDNVAITIDK